MDAPLSGTSQGYGASDFPNIAVGSSSFNDPDWDSLLECYFGVGCSNSQCSVNDLLNEPSNAPSFTQNEASSTPSVPSDCKLQPRVYSPSPSLIHRYTPPPTAQVVELHLPADVSASAPLVIPSHPIAADLAVPVIMPHHLIPAHVVPLDMPFHDVPSHMLPSHFLPADVALHVNAPRHITMPPQQQPPPYPNFNTHQFDACPSVMYSTGSPSHDPHHNFSFSDVEAKHKNQLSYDPFHDASKLKPPMYMHHQYLHNSKLPGLEVPRSPIACGTTSPAYMQRSPFSTAADSDSAAMEMSSMSAPAGPGTSNASFYWRSTPPERKSFSVPPSPTPSVNKKESANEKMTRSPHGNISKVAFRVKTTILNLHDGYTWKKYGEKIIKKHKFTRSYFRCDEKDRRNCEVVKRTQKCSDDEDYILFTYEGRHNHPT